MNREYIIAMTNNQIDDLKCCGNCCNSHEQDFELYCKYHGKITGQDMCGSWQKDGLSKNERKNLDD